MEFSEYEKVMLPLARYPNIGTNIVYPALGLAGEAGETAEKIKKLWRNSGVTSGVDIPSDKKAEIVKEMGDALWYLAALASEVGSSLEEVAKTNIEKLLDRNARGVLKSEGDNR